MLISIVKNPKKSLKQLMTAINKNKKHLLKAQADDLIRIKQGMVKGSGSLCDLSINDTIKRITQEYWTSNDKRRHEFLFKTDYKDIHDMDVKTILFYHKYKRTPKPIQGGKYSPLEQSVLFNKSSNNGGLPTKTLMYLAETLGERNFKKNTSKKKLREYLTYVLYLRGGKTKFQKYLTPKRMYKKKAPKNDKCADIRNMKLEKGKNCEPPINYRKTMLKVHPDKAIPECKEVAKEKTQELNDLCDR